MKNFNYSSWMRLLAAFSLLLCGVACQKNLLTSQTPLTLPKGRATVGDLRKALQDYSVTLDVRNNIRDEEPLDEDGIRLGPLAEKSAGDQDLPKIGQNASLVAPTLQISITNIVAALQDRPLLVSAAQSMETALKEAEIRGSQPPKLRQTQNLATETNKKPDATPIEIILIERNVAIQDLFLAKNPPSLRDVANAFEEKGISVAIAPEIDQNKLLRPIPFPTQQELHQSIYGKKKTSVTEKPVVASALILSTMIPSGMDWVSLHGDLHFLQTTLSKGEAIVLKEPTPTFFDLKSALAEKGFLLEINHPLLPENTLVCEGVDKEGHGIPLKPGNYSLKQIKSVLENSGLRCMQRGRSLIITQKPPEKSRSLDLPFEAKIHFDVEGNEIVELGDPLRGSDLEFWAKNRAFARQLKETSLRTFIYYCKEDYKLEIDPGELRNRLGDILMVDSYTERTILNLLNEAFRKAGLNYHAGVREKESKISILPGPVPTEAPEKKSEGKSSVSTPKQPEKSVPPRRTTTPAKTR